MMCSFGTGPSILNVLPTARVNTNSKPAATIMDSKPMANISPFIMCTSLANPQVAAATSAAMGVLTPQPCIPNTVAPWTPGSATVMIGGSPALNSTCTLNCLWAGVITITMPGQMTVNVK
jgi:hypothetical protein